MIVELTNRDGTRLSAVAVADAAMTLFNSRHWAKYHLKTIMHEWRKESRPIQLENGTFVQFFTQLMPDRVRYQKRYEYTYKKPDLISIDLIPSQENPIKNGWFFATIHLQEREVVTYAGRYMNCFNELLEREFTPKQIGSPQSTTRTQDKSVTFCHAFDHSPSAAEDILHERRAHKAKCAPTAHFDAK